MKKNEEFKAKVALRCLLCSILIMAGLFHQTESVQAAENIVGEVLNTEIKATIDGVPIPSYNISGSTAIVASDLNGYGFTVSWNPVTRSVHIEREAAKPFEPVEQEINTNHSFSYSGRKLFDVYSTDIKTYVGENIIDSYNIGGKTAIYLKDLAVFGTLEWQPNNNESSFLTREFKEKLAQIEEEFDTLHSHHKKATQLAAHYHLEAQGTRVSISGNVPKGYRHIMFVVNDNDNDKVVIDANTQGTYSHDLSFNRAGNHTFTVHYGKQRYSTFDGHGGEVALTNKGGKVTLDAPPTYASNYRNQLIYKEPDMYLGEERGIHPQDPMIQELAEKLTVNAASNYEKLEAIHQWVIENIAYDTVAYYGDGNYIVGCVDVLKNKQSVCSGYANLTAALLRSVNVPTRVVSGYALGASTRGTWDNVDLATVETNHAWNEVYADGRWVIIDTTWNAGHVRNKQFVRKPGFKYFDPTIEAFSKTHFIVR